MKKSKKKNITLRIGDKSFIFLQVFPIINIYSNLDMESREKKPYHKEISKSFALNWTPTMYVTKAYRTKCMRNIRLTTVAHKNCPTHLPGWF